MAINPNRSLLDTTQIFQRSFDQPNDRIRVDAVVSLSGTASEVIISHVDDSIRIGDGTNLVTSTNVGAKQGLDVNVINDIALSVTHTDDSIRLGDGTGYLTTTVSGPTRSLDVNISGGSVKPIPAGATVLTYGVQTVAAAATVNVVQYVVPAGNPVYLQKIYISGESIGTWTVYINATVLMVARMTYTDFSRTIDLATASAFGVTTSPGDIIKVEVENVSASPALYDATIQTMNT